MKDYIEAHKFSNNHMGAIQKDKVCGCFYCLKIFSPDEIDEWIIDDNPCDRGGTAICPYCGIDSVIGESSGIPSPKIFYAGWNSIGLRIVLPVKRKVMGKDYD